MPIGGMAGAGRGAILPSFVRWPRSHWSVRRRWQLGPVGVAEFRGGIGRFPSAAGSGNTGMAICFAGDRARHALPWWDPSASPVPATDTRSTPNTGVAAYPGPHPSAINRQDDPADIHTPK